MVEEGIGPHKEAEYLREAKLIQKITIAQSHAEHVTDKVKFF